MAKTIKFNLILDGYPVRNLEGVQEHFSIEDMLKYFKNGLLHRWLDVRGYKEQYDAVKKIKENESVKEIIKKLIRIFNVEQEDADIEKNIRILEYLEEEKALNAIYRENAFKKRTIIDDYHSRYKALILHMVENKDNMALIKADILEMEKEYLGLFYLQYVDLYFEISKDVPKAVFAMLTRDVYREKWLNNERIIKSIKNILLPAVKDILGDDLKIVKRNTQAMWDPIERPEIQVMVLKIEPGTFIKNAGNFSEKLSVTDIIDKFVILNGLEYQCNDANYELLYMEV